MRATTNNIIAASLFIRKPKFTLKLPVLNHWTEVSKIGCPESMNIFAKKVRAAPSIIPIKGKATKCA